MGDPLIRPTRIKKRCALDRERWSPIQFARNFRLHPLIHILLESNLALYVEAHAISFSVNGIGQSCNSDSEFHD